MQYIIIYKKQEEENQLINFLISKDYTNTYLRKRTDLNKYGIICIDVSKKIFFSLNVPCSIVAGQKIVNLKEFINGDYI